MQQARSSLNNSSRQESPRMSDSIRGQSSLKAEKLRRLRVVAFGCQEMAIRGLGEAFHRILGRVCGPDAVLGHYYFCEFLLPTPVMRAQLRTESVRRGRVQLVAPFLDREFYNHDFAFDSAAMTGGRAWARQQAAMVAQI